MDYQEVLKMVKAQNPDKSHKECIAIAKKLYQSYKKGTETLAASQPKGLATSGTSGKPSKKEPKPAGTIPLAELFAVETRIRKGGYDVNKIASLGHELMPDGLIVNHGKTENGINSYVTYEDPEGNRLPVDGFFAVWI